MGGKGALVEYTRRYSKGLTPAQKRELLADIKVLIENASRRLSVIVLVQPDRSVKKTVTSPKKRGAKKRRKA
jgi:hypothetical protein